MEVQHSFDDASSIVVAVALGFETTWRRWVDTVPVSPSGTMSKTVSRDFILVQYSWCHLQNYATREHFTYGYI